MNKNGVADAANNTPPPVALPSTNVNDDKASDVDRSEAGVEGSGAAVTGPAPATVITAAAMAAISIERDRLRTGEFMPSVKSVSRRSSRPTYTCRHQGIAGDSTSRTGMPGAHDP